MSRRWNGYSDLSGHSTGGLRRAALWWHRGLTPCGSTTPGAYAVRLKKRLLDGAGAAPPTKPTPLAHPSEPSSIWRRVLRFTTSQSSPWHIPFGVSKYMGTDWKLGSCNR